MFVADEFLLFCFVSHLLKWHRAKPRTLLPSDPFTILHINLKLLHLRSIFNFALNLVDFRHHPPSTPTQNPETTAPRPPLLHLENVKTIATPISPSQNSSDPEWLEFQKVEQKQNVPTNQMTACQLALDPLD